MESIKAQAAQQKDGLKQDRRLKAEWEEQSAILLAFPHAQSDWSSCIDEARATFIDIIEHILCFESALVCVDCDDDEGFEILEGHFGTSKQIAQVKKEGNTLSSKDNALCAMLNPNLAHHIITSPQLHSSNSLSSYNPHTLHIVRVKTNDTWARDFGGIGIELDKSVQMLDFGFNGWGLKFAANYDNLITQKLFKSESRIQADMVLEGGSIESNGAGVLLTNTQCLLEPNRNPHLNQSQIEAKLRAYFGLDSVLWLHHGYLAGDDTDSHIDTLARFIAPDCIAYVKCENRADEHFEALAAMEKELKSLKMPNGKPYKLVALPFVGAIYEECKEECRANSESSDLGKSNTEGRADLKRDVSLVSRLDSENVSNKTGDLAHSLKKGSLERLPATYANFLFVNNALLVPTYNDPNDALALEILSKALPHLKVLGIDCRTLIKWHGSLHCVTMQIY